MFKICDIRLRCNMCSLERTMFFTHLCCWKLVRRRGFNLSSASLWAFARQTRPIASWRYISQGEPQPYVGIFSAPLLRGTGLGRILRRVARLPREIEREVLSYLSETLVFSLVSSLYMLTLHGPIDPDASWKRMALELPLNASSQTVRLYTTPVRIFEKAYLGQLTTTGEENPASLSISLRTCGVQGLKYVLGTYGVCAVSVFYEDGSSSPWLGHPGHGWHARVYGRDLHELRFICDVISYPS